MEKINMNNELAKLLLASNGSYVAALEHSQQMRIAVARILEDNKTLDADAARLAIAHTQVEATLALVYAMTQLTAVTYTKE